MTASKPKGKAGAVILWSGAFFRGAKDRILTRPALWVKRYAHVIRVLAGFIFAVALIGCVAWALGHEVEAQVVLLMLLSSLFFSLPSIAAFVVPDRKPVRDMDFDELLAFVESSNPQNDWRLIQMTWAEEAFLKEDPRLRIRVRWDDEGVHEKDFKEPWANGFPDPKAVSYWYDITYDGALIERLILVSVDGGRAKLPLPHRHQMRFLYEREFASETSLLTVSLLDYSVAKVFEPVSIFQPQRSVLDEYMQRARLTVEGQSTRQTSAQSGESSAG